MFNLIKSIFIFIILTSAIKAGDCPSSFGTFGENIGYQSISCRFFIKAEDAGDYNRNYTFNDEGQIQVFTGFPGTKIHNSTGARVYYLFPLRGKKEITAADDTHLVLSHASGVSFEFDKKGRVSSPQLKMRVSKEINSKNNGGVEIENYPNGILIDLGWKMGDTPTRDKNAKVTITDKNNKKCTFLNKEFNKMNGDQPELIYKTNEALHVFLSKKCPDLDISDLLAPAKENLQSVSKTSSLGAAPVKEVPTHEDDSKRSPKPQYETMDSLLQDIDKKENGAKGTEK